MGMMKRISCSPMQSQRRLQRTRCRTNSGSFPLNRSLPILTSNAYPADLLGKVKTKEIRQANEEIKKLIYHTCGMEPLRKRMLTYGNRKNLLADYDQTEHEQDGFFIYRLY